MAGTWAKRGKHAVRTCLRCRKAKSRCELPDVTVTSSNTPLPINLRCRRCHILDLDCIVDDTSRKRTKGGVARYGADGLLSRRSRALLTQSQSDAGILDSGQMQHVDTSAATSPSSQNSPHHALTSNFRSFKTHGQEHVGPDVLIPGHFQLAQPNLDADLVRMIRRQSHADGSLPDSQHQSRFSPDIAAESLNKLQPWHLFLDQVDPVSFSESESLLGCTLSHLGNVLEPGTSQASLQASRNMVLSWLSRLFLSHEATVDSLKALVLLCLYDPCEIFLSQQDAQEASPGFKLIETACSIADRLGLCDQLIVSTMQTANSTQTCDLDLARLSTMIGLYALYVDCRALHNHSMESSPLARLCMSTVLSKCDECQREASGDQILILRIEALKVQFKLSYAFLKSFERLTSVSPPSHNGGKTVDEILTRFRAAVQASLSSVSSFAKGESWFKSAQRKGQKS